MQSDGSRGTEGALPNAAPARRAIGCATVASEGNIVIRRVILLAMLCLCATVSRNPFCAGALLAQQEPQMPPEGNPDHVEPPRGAYCDHSREPAHACACHTECVEDADGNLRIQEDGKHCRAFCFKKHCHCPAENCEAPSSANVGRH
jgi:hypothetical protein